MPTCRPAPTRQQATSRNPCDGVLAEAPEVVEARRPFAGLAKVREWNVLFSLELPFALARVSY